MEKCLNEAPTIEPQLPDRSTCSAASLSFRNELQAADPKFGFSAYCKQRLPPKLLLRSPCFVGKRFQDVCSARVGVGEEEQCLSHQERERHHLVQGGWQPVSFYCHTTDWVAINSPDAAFKVSAAKQAAMMLRHLSFTPAIITNSDEGVNLFPASFLNHFQVQQEQLQVLRLGKPLQLRGRERG